MIQKSNEYRTGNYALTTVLRTLGFLPEFPDQPCTNAYGPADPPRRDSRGRLEKLGKVTFMVGRVSAEYPDTPIGDIVAAYDGDGSDHGEAMDSLIADQPSDHIQTRELKGEIRARLPLIYAECARNALSNLRAVRNEPHEYQAHIGIKKPNGMPVIIPENASDEVLEKWGIKFKEASA